MSEVKFQKILDVRVSNLSEFHREAIEISKHFSKKCVVALSGTLGAGKTEFVKAVAGGRGFQDIASPTFAIHHHYQNNQFQIDHLDLYRLKNEDELETTGFWDFFSEQAGLIFIEWPERMELSHIPFDWDLFKVEIQKPNDSERVLIFSKRD